MTNREEIERRRTFAIISHPDAGKTTLTEKLLLYGGAINQAGSVKGKQSAKHAVSDWMDIEKQRGISVTSSVLQFNYAGKCVNILDTPGGFDFAGEVMEALRAADAAIIVCSAKDGISVGLEKAWKYCEERNMPRFIYISKTDEENSDYNATFDALRERFGNKIAPLVVPIWDDNKRVTGIIDVLNKRAYEMHDLSRVEIEVPADKESVVTEFNDRAGVVFALRGITPALCVEEALLGMMHRKTIIVPSVFMRLCTSAQRLVPIPLLMPIVARQQKKKLG